MQADEIIGQPRVATLPAYIISAVLIVAFHTFTPTAPTGVAQHIGAATTVLPYMALAVMYVRRPRPGIVLGTSLVLAALNMTVATFTPLPAATDLSTLVANVLIAVFIARSTWVHETLGKLD